LSRISFNAIDSREKNQPITDETNEDLAANNTDNLEIGDGEDPVLRADFVLAPALWPHGIEERHQVTDGEEYVTWSEVSCWRN